jgi:hypothetical protein
MVKKMITRRKKTHYRKSRKLNKVGGIGTAERLAFETRQKATGIFSKLDSLIDINRETTENIHSKIQELKTLYGIGIQAVTAEYDIGAAEHESPSYDIAQAHHESPSYDIAAAAEEGEYTLLEPLVQVKKIKNKNAVPFVIKPGSWDFFILQILDNEPKSENEISALMRDKFPTRMSGKTPDNTLNTRLQILVKEGYANRAEYKKGSAFL